MKLLGAAGDAHKRALLSLTITSGRRQSDIFALCWGDVDLAAGAAYVTKKILAKDRERRPVRTEPKTPNSRRVIDMPCSTIRRRVARTVDEMFAALELYSRTIVVNAANLFGSRASVNARIHYSIGVLTWWR